MSDADYAALQLRRGASVADVRRAYHELSRRHHPDKGGDASLFRRIAGAHERLVRGGDDARGGAAAGAPLPRTTREDAPSAWGDATRGARDDAATHAAGAPLALEHDPRLEAAFRCVSRAAARACCAAAHAAQWRASDHTFAAWCRFAGETRKHLSVIDAYPAHKGWTFDTRGTECDQSCLTHITPATTGGGVVCDLHKRVHRCAADVCCSQERACPMTVLCLANQWRARAPGVLKDDATLAAHRCTPTGCSWTELPSLRFPAKGPPARRVYVCAASGRPHICTAAQCRAGREARVIDERGGLARQWRCQISCMPLGPLMPWAEGTTLALGTGEVLRLTGAGVGGAGGAGGTRGGVAPGRGGSAQPAKRPRLGDCRR
jgi:hypothetical protein